MNNIYNSGEIPEDLCRSFLTADKESRSNETIILKRHRTKLITRILKNGTQNRIRIEKGLQYNFVKNTQTRNAIFRARMLSERST